LTEECIEAVRAWISRHFEEVLTRGLVLLGHQGLLRKVIGPLTQLIGEHWREGTLTAAHEHFASASLRVFLANASRPFAQPRPRPSSSSPHPTGQLHELGAVIISFLGPELRLERGVSRRQPARGGNRRRRRLQKGARAVALSIVYPSDDPALPEELVLLRKLLPRETPIIVGRPCRPGLPRGPGSN
jgi:MerR family transcriptional regulator, light-induced transcriptional regulator